MAKKGKSFSVGDYVFAKVKGYPPWPAKVIKISKKKCSVHLFGTGESTNVNTNNCYNYLETKKRFNKAKAQRRSHFVEAIDEIEHAMETEAAEDGEKQNNHRPQCEKSHKDNQRDYGRPWPFNDPWSVIFSNVLCGILNVIFLLLVTKERK